MTTKSGVGKMVELDNENRRMALLIDGDNAQASIIDQMIAEVIKYGVISIRRIYGDWTTNEMNSWKEVLNVHAVQPMQQFRYTKGKNATDSALIIDAMDILHSGNVNGFAIASSDSDYTRLATRIRESGLFVMGLGKQTTPKPFVNACEIFVYTEILSKEKVEEERGQDKPVSGKKAVVADASLLLASAYNMDVPEDGWLFLGTLGWRLRRLDSAFDSRTYGFNQLSQLVKAHAELFDIKEIKSGNGPSQIYIKTKDST